MIFGLFGVTISTKTDSRFLASYLQQERSLRGLNANLLDMYKRTPPAEASQPAQTLEQRCMDVETTFKR